MTPRRVYLLGILMRMHTNSLMCQTGTAEFVTLDIEEGTLEMAIEHLEGDDGEFHITETADEFS